MAKEKADLIRQLSKKWLESGDDRVLHEFTQAVHDGVHFPIGDRSIVERYCELGLELHAHFFNVRNAAGINDDLCAVAQYLRRDGTTDNLPVPVDHDNVLIVSSNGRQGERSVFINVRELVQDPQRMEMGIQLPTLVRLQTLNDCLRLNGYATESIFLDMTGEPCGRVADGEHVFFDGGLVVGEHQLPHDVIECRPKVMQTFSDDDAKREVGFRKTHSEAELVIASIDVSLGDHAAFFQARLQSGLYRCKMFLSPDEFLPNAVEGMVHSTKSQSNEFGLEVDNQVVNHVDSESHSPEDWLRFDHVRLSHGYLKGDLHIFVFFRGADEECLADFQHVPEIRRSKAGKDEIKTPSFGGDSYASDIKRCCEQAMMLIGNVELMDRPEITALPVFVRFESPDSILRTVPHALYLSSKRGFVNLGAFEDRKHSLIGHNSGMTFNIDKMDGQMIQSTSEIVDDIARDQRDVRVNFSETGRKESVQSFVSSLRIRLGADSVRLTFDKSIFNDFEILEVCLGPFDFSTDERKSFIGSH